MLVLHGSDDRMVSPAGSRRFAASAASADKQLIEYPGGYHALFADYGREQVLADVGPLDRGAALTGSRAHSSRALL